ncbi:MAG: phosphotransferase [Planctomycetes bacterium]|nr:phosphotransferase [Planctomycetota bacterium]
MEQMAGPEIANLNDRIREVIGVAVDACELGIVRQMTGLPLGFSNVNFRIETDQGIFLARLCCTQSDDRIRDEARFLDSIRDTGFPASYPISRTDGTPITFHDDQRVMMYDFIVGEEPSVTPDSARQVGDAIGLLATLEVPASYSSRSLSDIDEAKQLLITKSDKLEMYPEFHSQFQQETEEIESFLQIELPRGFVHADAFPDNTIFRDGKLIALIDFEDSCEDSLLFDVGMTILGFGYRNDQPDSELIRGFLEGYQARRQLSDLEVDVLPTMVRWCAHGMTLWHLQRFIEDPTARQQRRISELQRLIERLHGKDADVIRSATGK